MKPKKDKFSRKVYVCPDCFGRLPVSKGSMKKTGTIYHCDKYHSVTWETVMTFDSENEYRAWQEFKLDKDKKNLRHHVKFQIQPRKQEAIYGAGKPFVEGEGDFEDWYRDNVNVRYATSRTFDDFAINTPAEFYESDMTYEDKDGLHVIEVKGEETIWRKRKGQRAKVTRPFFPKGQSEKKLYRIATYLKKWYGLDLEVYTGRWWDFNRKGRLEMRGT